MLTFVNMVILLKSSPIIAYTSKNYKILWEFAKYYEYSTVKTLEFFLNQFLTKIETVLVLGGKIGQPVLKIHNF